MQVKHIHFETIDSTNTWCKTHLEDLDRSFLTLVTAEEQTAGRGRWKRSWSSPKGANILASFCFFLKELRPDMGNIPQVLSISASRVLRELGFDVTIKWPNDIILNKKKLGGILCETSVSGDEVGVIVGIGLNVNMEKKDLQAIDRPATSLYDVTGKKSPLTPLLEALINCFKKDLEVFLKQGFKPFYKTYVDWSSIRAHEPLIINIYPQKYPGKFHALQEDGSIILKSPEGILQTFHAGEIIEK